MTHCESCSMEATHTFIDKGGLVHNYCEHHAPKGSVQKGVIKKVSVFVTYRPLIIATAVVLLYVAIRSFAGGRTSFIEHVEDIMGGYFLVFGILQIFSGSAFAEAFKKYDPLGRRFPLYARIYPSLLLFFGLMHHIGKLMVPIACITIVIFTIQSVGIWRVLKKGAHIQCACIGTKFSLPLSMVTIVENVLMVILALIALFFHFFA